MRQLIPLTEACDVLDIPHRTGYTLVARGEFPVPTVRIGRAIKVSQAALDAFVASLNP